MYDLEQHDDCFIWQTKWLELSY